MSEDPRQALAGPRWLGQHKEASAPAIPFAEQRRRRRSRTAGMLRSETEVGGRPGEELWTGVNYCDASGSYGVGKRWQSDHCGTMVNLGRVGRRMVSVFAEGDTVESRAAEARSASRADP
jgi:hypothetical protein